MLILLLPHEQANRNVALKLQFAQVTAAQTLTLKNASYLKKGSYGLIQENLVGAVEIENNRDPTATNGSPRSASVDTHCSRLVLMAHS